MSLNNLELSAVTIADLYKKTLVELPDEAFLEAKVIVKDNPAIEPMPASSVQLPVAKTPIQYLGKNGKNVTVVVHYPNDVYLPEDQLSFLTNVLKACNLNMGDIAIVNSAKQKMEFGDLLQDLAMKQLLLFGKAQEMVADGVPFTINIVNGISVLPSPALDELNQASAEGKVLKANLWACLKKLFNV